MSQSRHEFQISSVANSRRASSRPLIRDEGGFTGAEKALVACLALALILTVTKIILGGAGTAAEHAKQVLEGQGDKQAWSVSEVNPSAASNEESSPKPAANPTLPSAPVAAQTAPPKEERSFWEKVKQRGFWGDAWDLAAGTVVGAGNAVWGTVQLAWKTQPAVQLYNSTRRLLDPELAKKEDEQNIALVKAIWNKPGILWDAVTEDYANDVREGRPLKAVGRFIGEFLPDLLLDKGLGQLSRVNKIDKVIVEAEHVESALTKGTNHLDSAMAKVDHFEGTAVKAIENSTQRPASSSFQKQQLREHLRQIQEYGPAHELPDGRIRYYGDVQASTKPGEMAGRRVVREWNPETGAKRTWHETIDHEGRVRQVRPDEKLTGDKKVHYRFDRDGNYIGKW